MKYFGDQYEKRISKELAPSDFAIRISAGDDLFFEEDILVGSSRLQQLIAEHRANYPPIEHLVQDVYHCLYKYDPELENYENMALDFSLNQQVIERTMTTKIYGELRRSTKVDQLSSQISTEILCENIMEVVKQIYKEQEEKREEIRKLQQQIKEMQEAEDGDEDGEGAGKAQQFTLEEAKKKLEETRKEMKELFDGDAQRQLVGQAQISLEQINGVQDYIQDWGLGNDGSFQKMPYREKVSLIERLKNSQKLKHISLMAGRLKEIYFEGKKATTKRSRSNIEDMSLGNDVGKVIPADIASLALPASRALFYKAYTERTLRQHEYGGKSKKGKGALVALIDTSGSMHGKKEIWAKAVALTLLDISRKQKRDFFVVHFDSGTHKDKLHTNSFTRHDPYNITEIIDMAEYFGGGGTEFEPPMDRARDKISEETGFSKADIVMISDGQSAVGDRWLSEFMKWKAKNNVVVYSIMIDENGSASRSTLDEFSDQVQRINDVDNQGSQAAVDLFKNLNY